MGWLPIRSARKKSPLRRVLGSLPRRSVVLVEDETDLLLFPPLRAMWSARGVPVQIMLSGANARRVVFGCMNLATGHRVFLARRHQRAEDFQAFLRLVRRRYRGWQVTLVLDGDRSHDAKASQALAQRLGIRLLWLPKRAPELNPMDTPWGQGRHLREQTVHGDRRTSCVVHRPCERLDECASAAHLGRAVETFLAQARTGKEVLFICLVPSAC